MIGFWNLLTQAFFFMMVQLSILSFLSRNVGMEVHRRNFVMWVFVCLGFMGLNFHQDLPANALLWGVSAFMIIVAKLVAALRFGEGSPGSSKKRLFD